jgi:hypothetical protein
MEKYRINPTTTKIISHNIGTWLKSTKAVKTKMIAPDSTPTLEKASEEQNKIGWGNWLKGRISREWGTLVNYDIKNIDSGQKFNTSEKWATEVILLNWEFAQKCWEERNKIEHDIMGQPEERKKEKIIEIIVGEHKMCVGNRIYEEKDLNPTVLQELQLENLQMIHTNIKNVRKNKRKKTI